MEDCGRQGGVSKVLRDMTFITVIGQWHRVPDGFASTLPAATTGLSSLTSLLYVVRPRLRELTDKSPFTVRAQKEGKLGLATTQQTVSET